MSFWLPGAIQELMSREYHGLPKSLLPAVITVSSPSTGNDEGGEPTMKPHEVATMVYEHWVLSVLEGCQIGQ